jgi:DNA (cytosine-5)-methyltransferase 1
MENVPQVIGCNAINDFQEWRAKLESLGYSNYVEVLNAKDYGIPQNRERCFMVSILGDYNYNFPKKIPLEKKLKDLLEDNVDEKYYLSDKMIKFFYENEEKQKEKGNGFKFGVSDGNCVAKTITTRAGSRMDDNFIDMQKCLKETLENNNVEDIDNVAYIDAYNRNIRKDNISCAITTRVDASNNSYLLIKEATKKGYKEAYEGDGIDISGRMETHRGTVQSGMAQTIKTSIDVGVVVNNQNLRIRKLTPKECFRLMGVKDEDYENIAKNQSNSKLYHLAGDSIVVNVLMGIFRKML